MTIEKLEGFEVWQLAHALVLDVYRATEVLPETERFGLLPQMRRAATSVAANIAEGFARRAGREKAHFYVISQSSLEELRYYCRLCHDLGWGPQFQALEKQTDRIGRMLTTLVRVVASPRARR